MSKKLYASLDHGGICSIVNSLNPANPQDLATRAYVDTSQSVGTVSQSVLWESLYAGAATPASSTSSTFVTSVGLPPSQTFQKQRGSTTKIRVKYSTSGFVGVGAGQVTYGVALNGGSIRTLGLYLYSTLNAHYSTPVYIQEFSPADYSQVASAGPVTAVFYVSCDAAASVHWNVDAQDMNCVLISEVFV